MLGENLGLLLYGEVSVMSNVYDLSEVLSKRNLSVNATGYGYERNGSRAK